MVTEFIVSAAWQIWRRFRIWRRPERPAQSVRRRRDGGLANGQRPSFDRHAGGRRQPLLLARVVPSWLDELSDPQFVPQS